MTGVFFDRLSATGGAAVLPDAFFTAARALVAGEADLFARAFSACILAGACSAFVVFFFDKACTAVPFPLSRLVADGPTLRDTIFSAAAAFICADFARPVAGRVRPAGDLTGSFFSTAALRDFVFVLPARPFLAVAALDCLLVPLTDGITRYSSVAPLWRRDPRANGATTVRRLAKPNIYNHA